MKEEKGEETNQGSPYAIIIAPTRELAIQTFEQVVKYSHDTRVKGALIVGQHQVANQVMKLRRGCDIVSSTIGRLLDFVKKGIIRLENVKFLVLDEADKMLEMGFDDDVRALTQFAGFPEKSSRQTLMFSATFQQEIQNLAKEFLNPRYAFLQVGELGGANRDIVQKIELVPRFSKKDRLVELLQDDIDNEMNRSGVYKKKTLVFVEQKRMADMLASNLSLRNVPATTIHGDRDQRQREQALRDFRTGKMCILIATAVAERGLDIVGVDHVISYDLPSPCDPNYVHRIGRTGRVGNRGRATAFFDEDQDRDKAMDLVKILTKAMQEVPTFLQEIAGVGGGGVHSHVVEDDGGW